MNLCRMVLHRLMEWVAAVSGALVEVTILLNHREFYLIMELC